VLALGVFLVCSGYRRPNSPAKLFVGSKEEGRFSEWLNKITRSLSVADVSRLGCLPSDIGTHSLRKGAPTYVSSFPGGPSCISLYLRCGWSLGSVQHRYIHATDGGDQFVGRCATGLPLQNDCFDLLPPHFINAAELNNDAWEAIFPGYENFCESFKTTLPFLLASLVFHSDWLRNTLPQRHPLFNTRLFSEYVENLKPCVQCGYGQCVASGITATGIPPFLAISSKVNELIVAVRNVTESVVNSNAELASSLPTQVTNTILQNVDINGAMPITRDDLNREFERLRASLIIENNRNEPVSEVIHVQNTSNQFQTWTWKGRIHPVPQGFRFPT
jgi:hypothetical protein